VRIRFGCGLDSRIYGNNKCYTWPPKLLCNFCNKFVIYKCSRGPHKTTWPVAAWRSAFQRIFLGLYVLRTKINTLYRMLAELEDSNFASCESVIKYFICDSKLLSSAKLRRLFQLRNKWFLCVYVCVCVCVCVVILQHLDYHFYSQNVRFNQHPVICGTLSRIVVILLVVNFKSIG
jgi:hypothetical protein